MPLEIRELIIRTQIVSNEPTHSVRLNNGLGENETKVIVDQCVSRILKSLKKKTER